MNTSLISQRRAILRPGGSAGGNMQSMMRMMLGLMNRLLQGLLAPQGSMFKGSFVPSPCSCGRPQFGQGPALISPSGNPVSGFLGGSSGSPGGSFGGSPFSVPPATDGASFAGVGGGDFASRLPGPMQALAPYFQAAGQKYNVDPKFLAAISMLETGRGTSSAFRNKQNAMGVSNSSGPISFSHPAESIERMARVLASNTGPYRGATTIGQIGRIYAPPGAGNDVHGTNGYWATGVSKYYAQLGGNPAAQVLQRA